HRHHLSYPAWLDPRRLRPEWFSALCPDSPISGGCGTLPGSNLQVTFLHRGLSGSDPRWLVLAGKQICPVGAASSRPGAKSCCPLTPPTPRRQKRWLHLPAPPKIQCRRNDPGTHALRVASSMPNCADCSFSLFDIRLKS